MWIHKVEEHEFCYCWCCCLNTDSRVRVDLAPQSLLACLPLFIQLACIVKFGSYCRTILYICMYNIYRYMYVYVCKCLLETQLLALLLLLAFRVGWPRGRLSGLAWQGPRKFLPNYTYTLTQTSTPRLRARK